MPLRRELCRISERAVNIQETSSYVQSARDVLFDQPYVKLIDADENTKEESAQEARA